MGCSGCMKKRRRFKEMQEQKLKELKAMGKEQINGTRINGEPVNEEERDQDSWRYVLFICTMAGGLFLGLVIPRFVSIPEAVVERWIMAAMIPCLIAVLWKLK